MQQFSLDTDISLDQVLKMPHYFIEVYYQSSAWKLKKEDMKKNVQMNIEFLKFLRK